MRLILALPLLLAARPVSGITIRKPAERKKAPDFELNDATGRTVRLSDYKGNIVVLGISMDEDRWDAMKPFMENVEMTYPVLMGTRRMACRDGDVEGLPVAFFVDREQRVAAIHAGAASRKSVERTIQTLLNATQ